MNIKHAHFCNILKFNFRINQMKIKPLLNGRHISYLPLKAFSGGPFGSTSVNLQMEGEWLSVGKHGHADEAAPSSMNPSRRTTLTKIAFVLLDYV